MADGLAAQRRARVPVAAGAHSGDPAFSACLRLFSSYPLAVRRHYAEHRYGSLVLRVRAARGARFYVLIMEWDDLFVIRPWDRRDGARVEIRRGESVSGDVSRMIESAVPVPRDGALLGWLAGRQVQAVLAAYGRLTEPWDDPSVVPGVLVMPHIGSQPTEWPPFAAAPLGDMLLWECLARASSRTSARWSGTRPGACSGCQARMGAPGARTAPGSS
jgi:hypothetical protein